MSVPGRRPALVVAALAAVAVAAVVVLVAAAHVTPVGHGHAGRAHDAVPTYVLTQQPTPSVSARPHEQRNASVTPLAVVFLLAGLLATLAGVLIIVWLIRTALRRRSLPGRVRFGDPGPEPSTLVVAQQVGSAVDRALSELAAGGPVDDAIIRCWLRLEEEAAAAGVDRNPSDTPEEAIERVFAAGRVRADQLRTLAALYREARFSRHPMSQADAERARVALSSIVDDLGAGSERGEHAAR